MKLNYVIAGIAAGMIEQVTRLEIDGVLYGATAPPPIGGGGEELPKHLSPSYFTSEDLKAAVKAVRPSWKVIADNETLDGSGTVEPALHYGSAPPPPNGDGETMNCMNPDHPYWANFGMTKKHVEAMVAAAPSLKGTVAALKSTNEQPLVAIPISQWETGPNSTDPASMSFLIMYVGPGGRRSYLMAVGYRIWYYQFHGRQAMTGPKNPEALALGEAQFQALRAYPKSDVERMLRGEEPVTPIPT